MLDQGPRPYAPGGTLGRGRSSAAAHFPAWPSLQIYVHANNHAGYFPGAAQIDMKLLFAPDVRADSVPEGRRMWDTAAARPAVIHRPPPILNHPSPAASRLLCSCLHADRQGAGLPGHGPGGRRGEAGGRRVDVHAGALRRDAAGWCLLALLRSSLLLRLLATRLPTAARPGRHCRKERWQSRASLLTLSSCSTHRPRPHPPPQMGGTVFDLEEAELCYAPQYGSAKDVVNLAGMVAANVVRGDHHVVSWEERDWEAVAADPSSLILDVREPGELEKVRPPAGRGCAVRLRAAQGNISGSGCPSACLHGLLPVCADPPAPHLPAPAAGHAAGRAEHPHFPAAQAPGRAARGQDHLLLLPGAATTQGWDAATTQGWTFGSRERCLHL